MSEPPEPTLLPYSATWAWNSQAPPPNSGQIRSDSREWVAARLLSVDRRNDAGTDQSAQLALIKPGDALRLDHQTDPTRWARFDVLAAPQLVTDHFQIPVVYAAGAGSLPNSGTRILLTHFPAAAPAGDVVGLSFVQESPFVWLGQAKCKHGQVATTTFLSAQGMPLDYASMVRAAWRQQDLLNACNCPNEAVKDNAVLTLELPLTLEAGQRRIISQTAAQLTGPNFLFGPLTCQRSGAYSVQGSLQLASSVAQGALGVLDVVVGGAVALSFGVMDTGGKATAVMSGLVNMRKNDSVVFTFDNLSAASQTIQTMTFKVGSVWVP